MREKNSTVKNWKEQAIEGERHDFGHICYFWTRFDKVREGQFTYTPDYCLPVKILNIAKDKGGIVYLFFADISGKYRHISGDPHALLPVADDIPKEKSDF